MSPERIPLSLAARLKSFPKPQELSEGEERGSLYRTLVRFFNRPNMVLARDCPLWSDSSPFRPLHRFLGHCGADQLLA